MVVVVAGFCRRLRWPLARFAGTLARLKFRRRLRWPLARFAGTLARLKFRRRLRWPLGRFAGTLAGAGSATAGGATSSSTSSPTRSRASATTSTTASRARLTLFWASRATRKPQALAETVASRQGTFAHALPTASNAAAPQNPPWVPPSPKVRASPSRPLPSKRCAITALRAVTAPAATFYF
ncbi:hypothetical protein I552_4067 [Mycobacterium xenopi 3993]|nr:hypothetical protein I552_4067 [Mycobacterium xenopi 3993]